VCKKSPNGDKNKKNEDKKGVFDEFFCIFDEFLLPLHERTANGAHRCRAAT
jgi:hypothetical protein